MYVYLEKKYYIVAWEFPSSHSYSLFDRFYKDIHCFTTLTFHPSLLVLKILINSAFVIVGVFSKCQRTSQNVKIVIISYSANDTCLNLHISDRVAICYSVKIVTLLPLFVLICPVSGGALQLVGWLVGCISAGTRICTHRLKKYIPQSRCMKVDM
ncbi:hypothetical protein T4B_10090 [Trichinella pseudospiralis]|uniref:Uncharacterized protein n=1 Tax=Trichinella pseudospiralis TaxID=6337 RepID=A0A0V1IJ13_TRIPS|nr:hypothetical protein T4B_10090 [Trichinella pseudospiralis]